MGCIADISKAQQFFIPRGVLPERERVVYMFKVTRSIVYTEQGENHGTMISMGLVTLPIPFGMGHTVSME